MPHDPLVSQAEVKGRFDYDPETGVFTDKATGIKAGRPTADGYLRVRIGGRDVGLHRLAFMWMLGHWPFELVDHVNGDPSDNRWANIRPATARQNAQNARPRDSNFGYKGVHRLKKSGRWVAKIMVNGKVQNVPGTFESAYAAHQAYRSVATRLFGQFARFDVPLNRENERQPEAWEIEAQIDELERRKANLEQQLRDVDAAIKALRPEKAGEEIETPGKYATRQQVLEFERRLRAKQLDEFMASRKHTLKQPSLSS